MQYNERWEMMEGEVNKVSKIKKKWFMEQLFQMLFCLLNKYV
jgi:hypothetical protein